MATRVYRIENLKEYQKAGPTDLIRMLPAPGCNALFLPKFVIEILVYVIARHEIAHVSGPTGSAKTSLLEALYRVPQNFTAVLEALGFEKRPLSLYPVEMATFEAPGELYHRRALRDGSTYDEESAVVRALTEASGQNGRFYHLIWLREMGRVHSASVQGGLLDLIYKGDVTLPGGRRVECRNVAWVADSNYQAESEAMHTLVTLDDGLKRRFTVNLTIDYLTAEQELQVLKDVAAEECGGKTEEAMLQKIVRLGQEVRRHKGEGNLLSVPPPTIYGYLSFLRMAQCLPHLSPQLIAMCTLLGNSSSDDRKHVMGVFNEVFGLQPGQDDDPVKGGGLF